MTGFLIDTNIISELRKGKRANKGVIEWFTSNESEAMYLSVLVIGELRRGIELIRQRDVSSAQHLEAWLLRLREDFSDRLMDVTEEIAELWGQLGLKQPLPPIDGLLAATAMYHGFTLVTRNVADVENSPVQLLNPFC
ncbi:MAG: type II toxin-antitoxin system VapC family toxin [Deltaproteobacteria bacterium]|nr:type II toxin-antitoxin system VapC family toxin [Deltaproteobacteria bacterium]